MANAGGFNLDGAFNKVDPTLCTTLLEQGYATIDAFLAEEAAGALRQEIELLFTSGHMSPNQVSFQTAGGPMVVTKPHVFEADMHHAPRREIAPLFGQLFHSDGLVEALNAASPGLELTPGPSGKTLKLQHNEGHGGCFPWHYDNPGRPNKRSVTCLVYLNQDWKVGDGGEIVLAPFLGPTVKVEPLYNRAVFFLSDRILHRVLPVWMDSSHTNIDDEVFLKAKHLSMDAIPTLVTSALQRTLSRAVYREEYERSLRECFEAGSRGLKVSLALHKAHLGQLLGNPAVASFVERLRLEKVPLDGDTAT